MMATRVSLTKLSASFENIQCSHIIFDCIIITLDIHGAEFIERKSPNLNRIDEMQRHSSDSIVTAD